MEISTGLINGMLLPSGADELPWLSELCGAQPGCDFTKGDGELPSCNFEGVLAEAFRHNIGTLPGPTGQDAADYFDQSREEPITFFKDEMKEKQEHHAPSVASSVVCVPAGYTHSILEGSTSDSPVKESDDAAVFNQNTDSRTGDLKNEHIFTQRPGKLASGGRPADMPSVNADAMREEQKGWQLFNNRPGESAAEKGTEARMRAAAADEDTQPEFVKEPLHRSDFVKTGDTRRSGHEGRLGIDTTSESLFFTQKATESDVMEKTASLQKENQGAPAQKIPSDEISKRSTSSVEETGKRPFGSVHERQTAQEGRAVHSFRIHDLPASPEAHPMHFHAGREEESDTEKIKYGSAKAEAMHQTEKKAVFEISDPQRQYAHDKPGGEVALPGNKGKTSVADKAPLQERTDTQQTNVTATIAPTQKILQENISPAQLIERIAARFIEVAGNESGRVKITLAPPSLGNLEMDVMVQNGTVRVLLIAENKEVHQTLAANMESLRGSLQNQGLVIERCEVMMQDRHEQHAQGFSQQQAFYHEHSGAQHGGVKSASGNGAAQDSSFIVRNKNMPIPDAGKISLFV